MRRLIAIAALALGMVVVREAILPLTAQHVSAAGSPTMGRALFFCRRQHSTDQICVTALTKALFIGQPEHDTAVATDRACRPGSQIFAAIPRPDESN
jgi:hypothetical protein